MSSNNKDNCSICNGTGNQKIHGRISVTVKPCPNGCKNSELSHESDRDNISLCDICHGSGVSEGQQCICQLIQSSS